jgi:hypothetical protein
MANWFCAEPTNITPGQKSAAKKTVIALAKILVFIGFLPQPIYRIVLPRPGNLLDSALGTFDVENVLKERMHVQPEETRCRGVRRSPEGD